MDFIKLPLTEKELFSYHYLITYFMIGIWIVFAAIAYFSKSKKIIINVTYFLIILSFFQELLDYINRIFINDLYTATISKDLPLQLCHFAYWFTVICLIMSLSNKSYKYKNFFFNCAYIFGFGAFQGVITVDITGLYTFGDILALHLQHSIIVLNLIWLIFCYGFQLDKKGIFHAFLTINILALFIGFINYFLKSNYMFLCQPPDINNIFIVGEWPFYIIAIEVAFIFIGYLLYLPFKLINEIKEKIS